MHFIIPFSGNLGRLTWVRLHQPQEQLPSPRSACWVFSCFCNPPNSDMDYRIFNMCDHLYECVYTWGLGTPTASQHIFDTGKTITNFSCAPDEAGV